jgi:hypothetical protein
MSIPNNKYVQARKVLSDELKARGEDSESIHDILSTMSEQHIYQIAKNILKGRSNG